MNGTWTTQTRSVSLGRPEGAGAPLNQPPVLASTFRYGGTDYARFGTDSYAAFQTVIGALEGGPALAFASGMAAIAAVIETLPVGAKVVTSGTIYHGVRALLAELEGRGRVYDVCVDVADDAALQTALDGAALVWIETPSNPLIQVLDVAHICALATAKGVPVAVDSTFATPLRIQPLSLGATYVVHSATKYIGGHSDLVMGVVIGADDQVMEPIESQRALHGAIPGALECFLALRGVRTLGVRLDRAEANAKVIAERLAAHPAVTRVCYPGLPSDPGYELAARQMSGPGAVLSFCVASEDDAEALLARLDLVIPATSLGSVETTAERRNRWHEGTLTGLIRLSVGIEDVEDIWADLASGLEGLPAAG